MPAQTAFARWIDTFVSEKGLDTDHVFRKMAKGGTLNMIPLANVIAATKIATKEEQAGIKKTFVMIDFKNGNAMHFFDHLAGALAVDL